MASIWKGSIAFGLVNIPVQLKPAVRTDNISFRMLHAKDLSPVKYERTCQADGAPVPWSEIVKGYEVSKGEYVVMTDEDFKAAALETSRTIDIIDFVKDEEIDPRFFETPYYLIPTKGGEKAYALLRDAVRKTGSIGIGRVTLRQTQHLAGVRVSGNALMLELMRFSSELVDSSEYSFPTSEIVKPQELQMAEQLIDNLTEPFEPNKYVDEYRANLLKIIHAKMKGRKPKLEAHEEERESGVIDLMARLRESLDQGAASGSKRGKGSGGRVSATRAKKSAAARSRRKSA